MVIFFICCHKYPLLSQVNSLATPSPICHIISMRTPLVIDLHFAMTFQELEPHFLVLLYWLLLFTIVSECYSHMVVLDTPSHWSTHFFFFAFMISSQVLKTLAMILERLVALITIVLLTHSLFACIITCAENMISLSGNFNLIFIRGKALVHTWPFVG